MKVILLMVMTLDGKIARNSSQFVDWSGREDKKYFVRITREAGVVVMGSRTFDTIKKPLPGRKNIVMTRNREKKSWDPDLEFTDRSPSEIIFDLGQQGFETLVLIGGAVINSLFAKQNLINEIHVTIVPALFGKGLSLFDQTLDLGLELKESREIDKGHLLLVYRVVS